MANIFSNPYNISAVGDGRNIGGMMRGMNTFVGGTLGVGLSFVFFIVLFVVLRTFGANNQDSMAASSFLTTILAFIFFSMGVMNGYFLAVFAIMSAASAVSYIWKK